MHASSKIMIFLARKGPSLLNKSAFLARNIIIMQKMHFLEPTRNVQVLQEIISIGL